MSGSGPYLAAGGVLVVAILLTRARDPLASITSGLIALRAGIRLARVMSAAGWAARTRYRECAEQVKREL